MVRLHVQPAAEVREDGGGDSDHHEDQKADSINSVHTDVIGRSDAELLEITPEIIRRYTEGQCHCLATAIYRETGWPIVEVDWGMHYVVMMPDGNCIDIEGVRTQEEMKERWNGGLTVWDKEQCERRIRHWGIKPDSARLVLAQEYVPAVLALAALNNDG